MNELFKVEGAMLVTQKGSYDLRVISSVYIEEDEAQCLKNCLRSAPWFIAAFILAGSIFLMILTGAVGFWELLTINLRIISICAGKKHCLYKTSIMPWNNGESERQDVAKIYTFITDAVKTAKGAVI